MENVTPTDLFYSTTEPDCDYIKQFISNHIDKGGLSTAADLVVFLLDEMTSRTKKCLNKNICDKQSQITFLKEFLDENAGFVNDVKNKSAIFENAMSEVRSKEKKKIMEMQTFLSSCDTKSTYASTVQKSDVVVYQKPAIPIKPINMLVGTGLCDIMVPIVRHAEECCNFTVSHNEKTKTFVMRINDRIFSAGPCDYVTPKSRQIHAKRCRNQPCRHTPCQYYHDPLEFQSYTSKRIFTISYIIKLINMAKNDSAICSSQWDEFTVQDLLQFGGSIIIKAAQIQKLNNL